MWFFVLLYATNVASNTLFIHSHYVNGILVTHSHPFQDDSSNHNHSSGEMQIISQSNTSYSTDDISFNFDFSETITYIYDKKQTPITEAVPASTPICSPLRAPPSF